jgi:hypothetical protein
MTPVTRRELLGALGGSLAIAAAGCSEVNQGQFVVVQTLYRQHPQADTDVQVEVVIENRRSNDAQGTLTVTLTHEPPTGESQTWTEERAIDQRKGTSQEYFIRFSDVTSGEFDRDRYSVEATLEEEGNDERDAQDSGEDESGEQSNDENTTAEQ